MSTPPEYFDAMYAGSRDPWSLSTRWYERRKHALTVAALTRDRYRSAFEPGCSVGALTSLLAPRCDRLLATDRVREAVLTARDRLGDRPGLRIERGTVPDGWPDGRFDLVVLSEVGYYLDEPGLHRLIGVRPGRWSWTVNWWPCTGATTSPSTPCPVTRCTVGCARLRVCAGSPPTMRRTSCSMCSCGRIRAGSRRRRSRGGRD